MPLRGTQFWPLESVMVYGDTEVPDRYHVFVHTSGIVPPNLTGPGIDSAEALVHYLAGEQMSGYDVMAGDEPTDQLGDTLRVLTWDEVRRLRAKLLTGPDR